MAAYLCSTVLTHKDFISGFTVKILTRSGLVFKTNLSYFDIRHSVSCCINCFHESKYNDRTNIIWIFMRFRGYIKCKIHNKNYTDPPFSKKKKKSIWMQFSSVQLLSLSELFATLWTSALQASLSITNSWSLPKLLSIESVMPSNYLILCRPFLLLPSIFPSIRLFSNESALCIRWPKYWNFSFSISPSNAYSELISFRIGWFDLLAVQGTQIEV